MIITRSPLRITLGGGGTDLPSYYRKNGGGFLIAAAIDKYVYITLHEAFEHELILKYSKLERVARVDDIQHPLIREALRSVGIDQANLEIASMADIPAGTGLGSSGSFTTALLKALHTYRKNLVDPGELARQACAVELDRLKEPVGKQDQYIAAYGGITCFRFAPDETVAASPLRLATETAYALEDNLMLFFTGTCRAASAVLKDQDQRSRENDREMIVNLDFTRKVALASQEALEKGALREFARLLDVHWQQKRKRSSCITNGQIDGLYELARDNGALGGKLIGAGGGGFLMFYTEDKLRLRQAMSRAGLREVRFRFDFEGTKVLAQ
jgi:D-glycero-alpha-D-manno-heptose-7-phosphate kinase